MKIHQRAIVLPQQDDRRSGIHVSSIIKWLLAKQDPKTYGGEVDDAARLRFELGFAWEMVALKQAFLQRVVGWADVQAEWLRFQSVCKRPLQSGESVTGTADATDEINKIIYETKLTRISSANDLSSMRFRHWHWQTMAYCHMRGWLKSRFVVCHLDGDWRQNRDIQLVAYDVQYSRVETARNWRMLVNAIEDMKEDGTIGS